MTDNKIESINWWKYQIDEKIIQGIKSLDKHSIRKFYEDNEQLIKGIAIHYWCSDNIRCIINRKLYSVEDMVAQIYIDLPLYNYTNSKTLYGGMRLSCLNVDVGGYVNRVYSWFNEDMQVLALDKVLVPDGKDFTLYKLLATPDTCEKQVIDSVPLSEWFKFEKVVDELACKLFPNDTYLQDKFIRSV